MSLEYQTLCNIESTLNQMMEQQKVFQEQMLEALGKIELQAGETAFWVKEIEAKQREKEGPA